MLPDPQQGKCKAEEKQLRWGAAGQEQHGRLASAPVKPGGGSKDALASIQARERCGALGEQGQGGVDQIGAVSRCGVASSPCEPGRGDNCGTGSFSIQERGAAWEQQRVELAIATVKPGGGVKAALATIQDREQFGAPAGGLGGVGFEQGWGLEIDAAFAGCGVTGSVTLSFLQGANVSRLYFRTRTNLISD